MQMIPGARSNKGHLVPTRERGEGEGKGQRLALVPRRQD